MTDIRFADISEFQDNANLRAYYAAGYRVLIIRSHNGYRTDHMMPQRLAAVRAIPFTVVGIYQYIVKDRRAETQAQEFIAQIGKLRPNEFPIGDYEEASTTNNRNRAEAWFNVVDKWAGFKSTLYSGDSFLTNTLGGARSWPGRPIWIAAYRSNEPTQRHTFWQYTSTGHFQGLGSPIDGNVFHGIAPELLRAVRGTAKPVPPPKPKQPEESLVSLVTPKGTIETFVETPSGEVLHRWQKEANDGWVEKWSTLGTPGK